jgi:signal transduction histidine kinase/CheY-like chemotaxis protein
MRWLLLIPFAALITNLLVSAFVFGRRRQSPVNWAFLLFLGVWAVWLALECVLCSPAFAGNEPLILKLMVPWWSALGLAYLNFVYRLLGRKADIVFYVALGATVAAICFNLFTDKVTLAYETRWWGVADLRDPLLHSLVCLPTLAAGTYGVALIARRYLIIEERSERRAFLVFLVGSVLTLSSIGVLNVLLPNGFGLIACARYGSSTAMFFMLAVYIAAFRFQFLGFTVDDVANELFEDLNDGVVLLDAERKVTRMNRAARRLLGIGAAAPLGAPVESLLPDGTRLPRDKELRLALASAGGERTVVLSPAVDLAGAQHPGSLLLLRDETEEREAQRVLRRERDELEREARRRTAELKRVQRLEALGVLAGGIGHDFNNLLAAAMGFATAGRDELPEGHPVREDLDEILLASRRGREIVRQMLAFSDDVSGTHRETGVAAVTDEALKLLRVTCPAGIEVERAWRKGSYRVDCDPTHLHQVIMNISKNGLHAMADTGGTLRVDIEEVDVDAGFAAANPPLEAGVHVRISIADSGSGMDAVTQERIFEPFFTTKRTGEGTGLGLPTALRIVHEHRGAILVESAPGRGSTFRIYLPRASGNDVAAAAAPAPIRGGSERVLFIDDKEQVVRMGKRLLSSLGYAVDAFTDPAAALEALARDPAGYDVLVTDLAMPDLSGIDVGVRARAVAPAIRMILISGNLSPAERERATAAGFAAALEKPLAKDELAAELRCVLDGPGEAR